MHIADDPLTAVAMGTGKVLDEAAYFKRLTIPAKLQQLLRAALRKV